MFEAALEIPAIHEANFNVSTFQSSREVMDALGEPKSDTKAKAVNDAKTTDECDEPGSIDFVTLGMFIIGKSRLIYTFTYLCLDYPSGFYFQLLYASHPAQDSMHNMSALTAQSGCLRLVSHPQVSWGERERNSNIRLQK